MARNWAMKSDRRASDRRTPRKPPAGLVSRASARPVAREPNPALGLVVAIPAVWLYNYFSGSLEYFNVEMDNSSSELVDFFIKKTA
jgi:hypothetical protein